MTAFLIAAILWLTAGTPATNPDPAPVPSTADTLVTVPPPAGTSTSYDCAIDDPTCGGTITGNGPPG